MSSSLDVQEGGDHYKKMKIQVVEFAHANNLDGFQFSIVKYACRFRDKNGLQDLKKARHFIDLLMELEYGYTGTDERVLPEVPRDTESQEATGSAEPCAARSGEAGQGEQGRRQGSRPQESAQQRGVNLIEQY